MEAHDGLSAKIVEESGFRGIWASGLTMSAGLGAPGAERVTDISPATVRDRIDASIRWLCTQPEFENLVEK